MANHGWLAMVNQRDAVIDSKLPHRKEGEAAPPGLGHPPASGTRQHDGLRISTPIQMTGTRVWLSPPKVPLGHAPPKNMWVKRPPMAAGAEGKPPPYKVVWPHLQRVGEAAADGGGHILAAHGTAYQDHKTLRAAGTVSLGAPPLPLSLL